MRTRLILSGLLLATFIALVPAPASADCPTGVQLRDIAQQWAYDNISNGVDPLFCAVQPSCSPCSSCAGAGVARQRTCHISGYSDFWRIDTPIGCSNSGKYMVGDVWWKPTTWQRYSQFHCGCSTGQTNWSCGWGV